MTPAPPQLRHVDRNHVLHGGKKLLYFGGCDYFRLSRHPRVLRAVAGGLKKFGLSVAASRITTGNHPLYETLETALAKFFEADSATVVSSGYVTGTVVAQALAGEATKVLIDEKTHGALVDAEPHFGCPVVRFRHRDSTDLRRLVRPLRKTARPIVLTDGLYAHDGSVAPLTKYLNILPKSALMIVDDSHGAGILGRNGRGSLEHEDVSRERVIQTVTLSKAFGVYGGAILSSREIQERIFTRSRAFIGSTPLPLPLVNGALTSVNLLRTDRSLRVHLWRNVDYVKCELRKVGLALTSLGPMLPIFPASSAAAESLKRDLRRAGIYPPFIKYPGGPADGYFRFVISSEHSLAQLKLLTNLLTAHLRAGRAT